MTSRSLHCLRCARPAEGFDGCRTCAAEGVGVNAMPPLADLGGVDLTGYPGGPWGLPAALPVSGPPVTLGEGNTPLIRLRDAPDRDGGHEERPCRQGLDALWRSGGTAVAVDDEAISAEHRRLAAEGLLLEAVVRRGGRRGTCGGPYVRRAGGGDRDGDGAQGAGGLTPQPGRKPRGGRAGPRPPRPAQRFSGPARCRAMTIRWIWLVPSTIWRTLASRI